MSKQNRFSEKFAEKSTSHLKSLLNNNDYQKDAQLAALWELERRGEASIDDFPVEEHIKEQNKELERISQDPNVTDDPSAPLLYHPGFVLIYGILFSVFLGGILLAINLSAIKKYSLVWGVLISSFVYTVAVIIILNLIGNNTSLGVITSIAGMYLIEMIFWSKKVDKSLKFRKRSIWGPMIFGIIIYIPLVILIFVGIG